MYLPEAFAEHDPAVLRALLRAHPLGTWVTLLHGELVANHVPFLLDTTRGAHGTLVGHVARANPVWCGFDRTSPSLVIFQGADAYITPSWYAAKRAHGKVVPTWNYAVVHAHGLPQAVEDGARLHAIVSQLTEEHEAPRAEPWQVTDAPSDFTQQLLGAIVGIEIPVDRLVGKWKVSQNRPAADRSGVVDGLLAERPGDDDAERMAALVRGDAVGDGRR